MNKRSGLWLLAALAAYVAVLCWLDRERHVFAQLRRIWMPLLLATVPVLLSYALRYWRWRLLLRTDAADALPWRRGFAAYLAGFALTASPGKAGELLRIRYFGQLGVAASATFKAFVCERALDLLVVAALGTFAARLTPLFGWALAIVAAALALLLVLATAEPLRDRLQRGLHALRIGTLRKFAALLLDATAALRQLSSPVVCAQSTLLGIGAWSLTSLSFVWICSALSLQLPWPLALGIFPLAMLLGALSAVPGGIGATEAAIMLMLRQLGADESAALAAAIGARLCSLWLAMLVGLASVVGLEFQSRVSPENA